MAWSLSTVTTCFAFFRFGTTARLTPRVIVLKLCFSSYTELFFPSMRWRCLWTFLFSNVPTFATSLPETLAAKGGITWARNGRWILPENARLPRNIQGSFTCRKSSTWYRRLHFPSEGRRAEDFFRPEKFNGFGRGWTGELGYQRPARYL